jgi:hypothetical protein
MQVPMINENLQSFKTKQLKYSISIPVWDESMDCFAVAKSAFSMEVMPERHLLIEEPLDQDTFSPKVRTIQHKSSFKDFAVQWSTNNLAQDIFKELENGPNQSLIPDNMLFVGKELNSNGNF